MSNDFELDARLNADTALLVSWPLCEVLLMNDSQYPWCILVPRRVGVSEIYQLCEADQVQLLKESSCLGRAMMDCYQGDKLNIGALGNVVNQLHVHHVVRFKADKSWPGPVWGRFAPLPYPEEKLDAVKKRLTELLSHPFEV